MHHRRGAGGTIAFCRLRRTIARARRRADLDLAIAAMAQSDLVYRHSSGIDMFLDGPRRKIVTQSMSFSAIAELCQRPELFNRIDRIVAFAPLNHDNQIAGGEL